MSLGREEDLVDPEEEGRGRRRRRCKAVIYEALGLEC